MEADYIPIFANNNSMVNRGRTHVPRYWIQKGRWR